MEKIINEYGKFLLDAMVVALLIAFLFGNVTDDEGNRGVFHIIGAHLQTWDTDYEAYTDYNSYAVESDCIPPVISYDGTLTMRTGTSRVTDFIRAKAWDGTELAVNVVSVKNSGGIDMLGKYNPDTQELQLDYPGIYTIRVSAKDAWNREQKCDIRIPVSR